MPENERQAALREAKIIVIKIGSAVLTGSDDLNYDAIASIAGQAAYLMRDLGKKTVLVSSGAVAAGKAALKAKGVVRFPNYKVAKHAIAAVGQSLLMRAWNNAFAPYDILTAQVLLTRDDLRSRQRFLTATDTFKDMLAWNVAPIVNENDAVSVSDLKFGDNDSLASLLVNLLEADLLINLTSAPGVMDKDPNRYADAVVLDKIDNIGRIDIDSMCGDKTELGSGGMRSKLLSARRAAQIGAPTLILPGREENILFKAFSGDGDGYGTWIRPLENAIPRRKFWLAYQSDPAGVVEIDEGAADALLYKGKSLLPGGVRKTEGNFEKGALLRVVYDGQTLGAGFSNYDSERLRKICGLKRHEIAAILGVAKYPDVIHRDNLLLDAAL